MLTSSRSYKHRAGLIFCFSDAENQFYGEAAPLPGFSSETLEEIRQQANQFLGNWDSILQEDESLKNLQEHYRQKDIASSLRFGLDSLAAQIEAQRSDQSLQSYLFDKPFATIAVNGLVSLKTKENTLGETEELTARGFKTIKCKVGINLKQELELLTNIRKQFPDLNIRLDANRAWEPEEANACLSQLETLDIEYCEEPLSKPTPEHYKKLSRQTSTPLALDESLNTSQQWKELLPYCSFLIIKPMVIGSFSQIQAICKEAQAYNVEVVFTSSLESGVGRFITTVLASGLGSKNYAHGLNTGEILADDLLPGRPPISDGSIDSSQLSMAGIDRNRLQNFITKVVFRS